MGLTQEDTTSIKLGWEETMEIVKQVVVEAGAFAWLYFYGTTIPPASAGSEACKAWFAGAGSQVHDAALAYQWNNATAVPLPYVKQDLAAFLLTRGPYAWIGSGWVGCITDYDYPSELEVDYGIPLEKFSETSPGVFSRKWTKADVSFDCNTWVGTITSS